VVAEAVAQVEAPAGVAGPGLADGPQGVLPVVVVGVEPGDEVARAAGHPLVDGRRLPAVAGAAPELQPRGVLADDGDAVVGGAAVDDYDLRRGVLLAEDAL